MAADFSIQIVRQGWITGLPDDQAKDDLCSHGAILLEIGGTRITTGEEDYGISESALALLRTLRSDHIPEARVAELLIFHGCGTILMMSCPIGVDWSVRHLTDAVRLSDVVRYDTTNEAQAIRFPEIDAIVPVAHYVQEVVSFARVARSVFEHTEKDSSNETIPGEYVAFWQEYETLLRDFG